MWEPYAIKGTDSEDGSFWRGSVEVSCDTYPIGKDPGVEKGDIGQSPSSLPLFICAIQVYGSVMNNLDCQLNLEPTKRQVSRNSCRRHEKSLVQIIWNMQTPLMWKAGTMGELLLFACFPSLLLTSSSILYLHWSFTVFRNSFFRFPTLTGNQQLSRHLQASCARLKFLGHLASRTGTVLYVWDSPCWIAQTVAYKSI